MKRLIVNADDFGFAPGVNRGIVLAHAAGAVSSTTMLATAPALDEAVALAKAHPRLGVGCHLALVGERAVSDPATIPSLAGADGRLPYRLGTFARRWLSGAIRPDDVARELRAQIERLLAAGLRLTHVDAHKHAHALPGVMAVVAPLCREYGIPAVRAPFDADPLALGLAAAGEGAQVAKQWLIGRALGPLRPRWGRTVARAGLRTPDRFHGVAFTGLWTRPYLAHVLSGLPERGMTELMTHPGVPDASLASAGTRLTACRTRELELLSTALPALLAEARVELVDYGALA